MCGDAGKGFAVVAHELAQRSAQAAKEIKDLIRTSSVEVASGVEFVSQTGWSLQTIDCYMMTMNQHMDAIATSAKEQSVGLSEVNTAVNQMDQVTQQNAAMAEKRPARWQEHSTEMPPSRKAGKSFDENRNPELSRNGGNDRLPSL